MGKAARRIARLRRRQAHLEQRVAANPERDLSFDVAEAVALRWATEELETFSQLRTARPLDDYHEDDGDVLWWTFPVQEPSHVGSPNAGDWPGYHTHWSPLPVPTKKWEAPAAGRLLDSREWSGVSS